MRLESNFAAGFPLFSGAHTPFVLITVKLVTPLKLSLKRGRYLNLGNGLAGEKPATDITIFLVRTEGEVWTRV
jgi:hypothetical protein